MFKAMNMSPILRPVIVMTLIGLTLSACGVKSSPQYPADITYPQHYPAADEAVPVILNSDKTRESIRSRAGSSSGIYHYPNSPSYMPPEK